MASAAVFPDGRIEDKYLKNICALFDIVHMGVPWAMEPTTAMHEALKIGTLKLHHPPERLQLDAELKALLRDFSNLVTWYREGALSSFLKAAAVASDKETRWEISEAIKKMGNDHPGNEAVKGLYPQILLHLYQQTEEGRRGAEGALESLETSASSLAEALGQKDIGESAGTSSGVEDLTLPVDISTLAEVIRGWTDLFPVALKKAEVVVTINHEIFQFLTEQFEEAANVDLCSASSLAVASVEFVSAASIPWQAFNSRQISIVRQKATDLFNLARSGLADGHRDHLNDKARLMTHYLESSFPLEHRGTCQLSLCFLPASSALAFDGREFLELFSGKLIIYLNI